MLSFCQRALPRAVSSTISHESPGLFKQVARFTPLAKYRTFHVLNQRSAEPYVFRRFFVSVANSHRFRISFCVLISIRE